MVRYRIRETKESSCLYMLPNIRLWIYNAHIWLVCSTVYKRTVVHLEEGIASVVLIRFNNLLYDRENHELGNVGMS